MSRLIPPIKLRVKDYTDIPHLPSFTPITTPTNSTLSHNGLNINEFTAKICHIYEESRFWSCNLFDLPAGQHTRKFIKILNFWLDQFNMGTPFMKIALKVFMVLPNLLLQKPSRKSKNTEHQILLEERLSKWEAGDLSGLLKECKLLQRKLVARQRNESTTSQLFVRFMLQGKVNPAIRLLENCSGSQGVLPLTKSTIDTLKDKHPRAAPAHIGSLLYGPIDEVPDTYFNSIDGDQIGKAIKLTKGAAGPSNMSGAFFNQICNKRFAAEGQEFREQVAKLARKLATEYVDPESIEAYTACKLIPLDKNPGVRPIGIGESLRRVVGKVISWTIKSDAMEAAGPLQVSAGIKSGSEGAVHAVRNMFDEPDTEGLILIDASNAFNSLNRSVALHNIQIILPEAAPYLINTYRVPSRLFIRGEGNQGEEILSYEGTTQGDNLGMIFYALSTILSIRALKQLIDELCLKVRQAWLADDASAVGLLKHLKLWYEKLVEVGVKYGYYVNANKTWLIVKNPKHLEDATRIFQGTGVNITTEGKRHLGACVGSDKFKEEYCTELVKKWCREVEMLSEIARFHPHCAYSAFIKGYQHKFTYFFRTIPGFNAYLKPLDDLLTYTFIPTLCDSAISTVERDMMKLPTRFGGLGIDIPSERAPREFVASDTITKNLQTAIINQVEELPDHPEHIVQQIKRSHDASYSLKVAGLMKEVSPIVKRALEVGGDKGSSNWLNCLPLKEKSLAFNRSDFVDGINIRYQRSHKGLPDKCACGAKFNLTHALNCQVGGYVLMRHDNLRDLNAKLLKKVCKDVEIEPHLIPVEQDIVGGGNRQDGARLDVRARGFWRPAQNTYLDIRTTNPFSATNMKVPFNKISRPHEQQKRREYNPRVLNEQMATLTACVYTTSGTMGKECRSFYKHLAQRIAEKKQERVEDVICWIRTKVSILCLRNTIMALRGSRTRKSEADVEIPEDFSAERDLTDL